MEHVYPIGLRHISTILNVRRHDYDMFKDAFTQCLKTYFNHIWKHAHTFFEDLFVSCLKAYSVMCEDILSKNFKYNYTMFTDVFTQCWQTCLHKIDDICYKSLKSFSFKFVQNGVFC